MSRVVHFDLSADEPQRAVDFYRQLFGWKVERWAGPAGLLAADHRRCGAARHYLRHRPPHRFR